jgi:hypothetical protein
MSEGQVWGKGNGGGGGNKKQVKERYRRGRYDTDRT